VSHATGFVQFMVLIRPIVAAVVYRGDSDANSVKAGPQNTVIKGSPWIVYSISHAFEEARKSAEKAAASIGEENIKFVKVVPHNVELNVN
jgi:acyl dehydratase